MVVEVVCPGCSGYPTDLFNEKYEFWYTLKNRHWVNFYVGNVLNLWMERGLRILIFLDVEKDFWKKVGRVRG